MNTATLAGPDVAKKRPEPEPTTNWLDKPKKPVVAQVRGSNAFRAWLDKLSKHDRRSVSDLVEMALARYAESIGFEPPPER